jgi:DNA-binding XRE family transcriptional regulator
MNRKHIGSNVMETVRKWEKDPAFKNSVEEYVEKAKLAEMLKNIREIEHMTQAQLAEKAHVPQSVIARIETGASKTLPRIDLFNRILSSAGYETHIVAKKKGRYLSVFDAKLS